MDPERWRRVEELYHAALDRAPEARLALLSAADVGIRREVESLLDRESAEVMLDRPAIQATGGSGEVALAAGMQLGPYRIEARIGAGGMGEVFRATDTRLRRTVALKVLPRDRAAAGRQRFLQEARAVSALNHPRICALFDIGHQDGIDFLVLEWLDGETLEERLRNGPLRAAQFFEYAAQVAEGLCQAHRRGLIHRDLKPANIMLTQAGAKLLDFGLAKAVQPAAVSPDDSTVTQSLTREGTIMGTFPYMAPEQLTGKEADARSDIFAFGAVLYEMVSGRRAFTGDSPIEVMAAVLHTHPPPPSSTGSTTNTGLDSLVARCLEKRPADRFQTMDEVLRALEAVRAGSTSPGSRARFRSPLAWRAALGLGLAVLLAAAYLAYRYRAAPITAQTPVPAERLTDDAGVNLEPTLSRDGNFVAFASDRAGQGNLDIWLKQIHGGDPIRLTTDPADDHEPAFSPNGTSIVFRSERNGGGIYLVPALGGQDTPLVPEGRRARFSPDGKRIVYWKGLASVFPLRPGNGSTFVFDLETSISRQIAPDFAAAVDPVWSPDGKSILVVGLKDASDITHTFDWWIVPLAGGAAVKCPVMKNTIEVPYAWLGDYVYYEEGVGNVGAAIRRIRIDHRTGQPAGPPENLTSGTADEFSPAPATGGRLVFASMVQKNNLYLLPLDANRGRATGSAQPLTSDFSENKVVAISADGRRAAVSKIRPSTEHSTAEVWGTELPSGRTHAISAGDRNKEVLGISPDGRLVAWREPLIRVREVFTTPFEGGLASRLCDHCTGTSVTWSPDEAYVLYLSGDRGDMLIRNTGSGRESVFLRGENRELRPAAISRDGKWLLFISVNPKNRADYTIYAAPFRPEKPPPETEWVKLRSAAETYRDAQWSPDGNLLYFFSNRDGHDCLWALHLNPFSKRPTGEPFAVQHFHTPALRLNPGSPYIAPAIGLDWAVLTLSERSSSLWLLGGAAK